MRLVNRVNVMQCLIVAIEEDDRRQLVRLLKSYGFEVALVQDADQALAVCRMRLPELIVMPETLEGIESYDFIREIHKGAGDREAKVLVYSERPEAGLIGRAIWSGASECFVKPFDASIIDLKLKQVGAVQGRN
jgi:DNA-binding response OmpR family regulator